MILIIMMPLILSSLLIMLFKTLINISKNKINKLNTFECGFETLSNNRPPFSIRFFKIIIIFLIFDIEIIIMLPMPFIPLLFHNFTPILTLLFILLLGLLIESKQGSLNWLKF